MRLEWVVFMQFRLEAFRWRVLCAFFIWLVLGECFFWCSRSVRCSLRLPMYLSVITHEGVLPIRVEGGVLFWGGNRSLPERSVLAYTWKTQPPSRLRFCRGRPWCSAEAAGIGRHVFATNHHAFTPSPKNIAAWSLFFWILPARVFSFFKTTFFFAPIFYVLLERTLKHKPKSKLS